MNKHFISILTAILLLGVANTVSAVVIDASNSATFGFDLSAIGSDTATGFSYGCNNVVDDCIDSTGSGRLLSGSSFNLLFGTTIGGSELGTRAFTNPFGFAINNVGSGLIPSLLVSGVVTTLYMTFAYDNDEFAVEQANLSFSGAGSISGSFVALLPPVSAPEPTTIALLGLGLFGLGFNRRKRI